MNFVNEKRNVRVGQSKGSALISITYENTVEIDPKTLNTRIARLSTEINHMKHHHGILALNIENAEKELRLLKTLEVARTEDIGKD